MNEEAELPPLRAGRARTFAKKAVHLAGREYVPQVSALGFWAICAICVGHADTARLLAVTLLVRAALALAALSSSGALKRRKNGPEANFERSRRNVLAMQAASVVVSFVLVGLLALVFRSAGQPVVAALMLLASIGFPARAWRGADANIDITYALLVTNLAMVGLAAVAWAVWPVPAAFALAYGARDWVSTALLRLIFPQRTFPVPPKDDPVEFAEVAKHTVVNSRRTLTYRLTKNALSIFGPFGNFAARTGRGLNMHKWIEPYVPHHRVGFLIFALLTGGGAAGLMLFSNKPFASLVSATLIQLCAIALNVLALWRYLPRRDDPNLIVEDDDDD